MTTPTPRTYDPRTFKALTFHDAATRFRDGADGPQGPVIIGLVGRGSHASSNVLACMAPAT